MFEIIFDHFREYKMTWLIAGLVAGGLTVGGSYGFVDHRVAVAMADYEKAREPIVKGYVDKLNKALAGFDKVEKKLLEQEMRELRSLYCRTPSARETLHAQIEKLQDEYRRLNGGAPYALPDCGIYANA